MIATTIPGHPLPVLEEEVLELVLVLVEAPELVPELLAPDEVVELVLDEVLEEAPEVEVDEAPLELDPPLPPAVTVDAAPPCPSVPSSSPSIC